jgi:hypothetical protein
MIFLNGMSFKWSAHEKLVCPYYMENNKAFTLMSGGKDFLFFFIVIEGSYQVIIDIEIT